jgi:hypothetical protein
MREASHGVGLIWFGTYLERGGQLGGGGGGLVRFGTYLGRGKPARGHGEAWFDLVLCFEKRSTAGRFCSVWRLPGMRKTSHGVGLVWFGTYLGRGRPARAKSGLV